MLTFVNEELFSYNTKTEKTQNGKEVLQLSIGTSNFLVAYAKGSKMDKYHNPQDEQKINKKHDIDMRDNPKIEPINREILNISYISDDQLKDPSLLMAQPTSIKVTENNRGIPVVTARCLQNDSPNKSNLYIIAFPFNGMILPIAEDPRYRIYKGLIMSSVRFFYYKNRRYRKILYLVIEPHKALFDPNHKHHTDVIDIKLESYAIYRDRETGEEKTNHETFTLDISDKISSSNWEYETLNEAKRIEPDTATPLWTTFKFDSKPNNGKSYNKNQNSDEKPRMNNKPKNGQKPGYIEGNTYVTTNKHGIRKEVSINQNRGGYSQNNNRNNQKKSGGDDFERMLRESGMYDEDYNRDNRRGGNRGKKGKKNNRRNNSYDDWN